jgi:hypothetical protein
MFIITIAVGGLPAVPVVVAAAEASDRRHAALEGGGKFEGRASMNAERGRLIVGAQVIGSEPLDTQMNGFVRSEVVSRRKSQRRLKWFNGSSSGSSQSLAMTGSNLNPACGLRNTIHILTDLLDFSTHS